MVEVKSSTTVKDYHRDDVAIQMFIAQAMEVPVASAAVACIDSSWTYPGNGDYDGLLVETDVTAEAVVRKDEVKGWISEAHAIVAKKSEPTVRMGRHCGDPFECSFSAYCEGLVPAAEHPISVLPGALSKSLKVLVETKALTELSQVPDALLNDKQQRIKQVALREAVLRQDGGCPCAGGLQAPRLLHGLRDHPVRGADLEGHASAQQIPFQFSVHRLSRTGALAHESFLDLSGKDPSLAFAKALLEACGTQGPVFSYNAGFEVSRIRELSARFPRIAKGLNALAERVVDLLPVARDHYYHPAQEGSWSIKAVLPTLCPELNYGELEGVGWGNGHGRLHGGVGSGNAPGTQGRDRAPAHRVLRLGYLGPGSAMVRFQRLQAGDSRVRHGKAFRHVGNHTARDRAASAHSARPEGHRSGVVCAVARNRDRARPADDPTPAGFAE